MAFTLSSTELAELICTRMSHDLIGNIGAVANAVELLDDDSECLTEIRPILELSASVLTARLKFFRLAFGLGNGAPKTADDLKNYITGYLSTVGNKKTPINLVFNVKTPQLYKIILPAVMTLADLFIRGGILQIDEQPSGLQFTASAETSLAAAKVESAKQVLNGSMPEENPSQSAPLLYLLEFTRDKNVSVTLERMPNTVTLRIG